MNSTGNHSPAMVPPDFTRCQAERSNGVTFMSLGGRREMKRCMEKPIYLAVENEPGEDGQVGSMALCGHCATALQRQMGSRFATLTLIEEMTKPDETPRKVLPGFVAATLALMVGSCAPAPASWVGTPDPLLKMEDELHSVQESRRAAFRMAGIYQNTGTGQVFTDFMHPAHVHPVQPIGIRFY